MGNIWTHIQHNKHIYLSVLIPSLTFLYLASMAVRDYSWAFIGSDGGDWLASSIRWMVPQPYGAPVFIVLGHLVNLLFPTNLPFALSTLLAALPTAITVYYVYLAVRYITSSTLISLTSAILTAGSAILLTQSTVIAYHAMAITFLTAAFYQYLLGNRYRVAILLALGLGVHIMILPIAVFWLVVEVTFAYKQRSMNRLSKWVKPILVFIGCTALFYSLILLLMYLPTPRYMAGPLSLHNVINYWTKTSHAIVGEISIFETPGRLWLWFKLMFLSFGVGLIPIWLAFKRPSKYVFILLGTIVFVMWYFITCLDVLTWTYIAFATPSICTLVGIGLSHLHSVHTKLVLGYACIILILNPFFMNANLATQANPQGRELLDELSTLPNNAIIVGDPGAEGFGIIYYIHSHPDSHIVPLMDMNLDDTDFYGHSYANYLEQTYHLGLDYTNTLTAVKSALDKGYPVYYGDYSHDTYEQAFTLEGIHNIKRVTGLTGLPRKPFIIWSEN